MATKNGKQEDDSPQENPKETDFDTVEDLVNYQNAMTTEMMEFQSVITKACLSAAEDWVTVAEAFELQRRRSLAVIETCAWIARKSADNVGDLITAKYHLDDDSFYEGEGIGDDDDDDDPTS